MMSGTKLMEVAHSPPTSKILPFCRAKMVVKCTSTGQFTGQRTIRELLLLRKKKVTNKKILQGIP